MAFKTEDEALSRLHRNNIKVNAKAIVVIKDTGLKLWSAIDYLCNHCKYIWVKETK
jgi:hypothetical protein